MWHFLGILSVCRSVLVILNQNKLNATLSAMNLILYFCMCLIYEIHAFEIDDNKYKVRKGFKALRYVTEIVSARSVISCASLCAKSDRCTHANYLAPTCAFINYESLGAAIEFETEDNSEFICEYNVWYVTTFLEYVWWCMYILLMDGDAL